MIPHIWQRDHCFSVLLGACEHQGLASPPSPDAGLVHVSVKDLVDTGVLEDAQASSKRQGTPVGVAPRQW